ncbi:hypothetical protein [Streptomyces griseosporeus]|uniref:hypothetical protein n=1 Tax=Streptomyces griseosporeus TaxID=1910 RepID=UPI00370154BD
MTAPAAVAIIRAEIEDAHIAEIISRPGMTAQRVVQALERAGWDITPRRAPTAPHNGR